jgi:hypothetical protein
MGGTGGTWDGMQGNKTGAKQFIKRNPVFSLSLWRGGNRLARYKTTIYDIF